jgi:hypothetical protein
MRVLIGCECSGVVRDAFLAMGHSAFSCDLKPTRRPGPHFQCDVRDVLGMGWDLGIFHPDCTFLTCSAEWAYADPDYVRYPGVGYHQKVKPGTLTGAARREARAAAISFVKSLAACGIPRIAIENPGSGALSKAWRPADQIIQPYEFGDDASKATGLWLVNLLTLVIDPAKRRAGRIVTDPRTGKLVERWGNQTDGGQNKLPPSKDRRERRSDTYAGIAAAMAEQWGRLDVWGAADSGGFDLFDADTLRRPNRHVADKLDQDPVPAVFDDRVNRVGLARPRVGQLYLVAGFQSHHGGNPNPSIGTPAITSRDESSTQGRATA